jgi:hypothetical protein
MDMMEEFSSRRDDSEEVSEEVSEEEPEEHGVYVGFASLMSCSTVILAVFVCVCSFGMNGIDIDIFINDTGIRVVCCCSRFGFRTKCSYKNSHGLNLRGIILWNSGP